MQNVQNEKCADKIILFTKEMRRYNILLDCIRIESTDGNFGTHGKVVISMQIVTCTSPIPVPIFGIFVFCVSVPMGFSFPYLREDWHVQI